MESKASGFGGIQDPVTQASMSTDFEIDSQKNTNQEKKHHNKRQSKIIQVPKLILPHTCQTRSINPNTLAASVNMCMVCTEKIFVI